MGRVQAGHGIDRAVDQGSTLIVQTRPNNRGEGEEMAWSTAMVRQCTGGVQCVMSLDSRLQYFPWGRISFGRQMVFHSAHAWARIAMAALCRPDTVTHGVIEVALLFQESQMFIRCDAGGKGRCLEPVHRSMVSPRPFRFAARERFSGSSV